MTDSYLTNSFVFFDSFLNVSKKMPEEDRRLFIDTVIEYGINGTEPENLPYQLELVFDQVKVTIDRSKKKYQTKVENGKKGGAPKGNTNAKKTTEKQPKTTEKQPKNNLKQPEDNRKTTEKQHNENDNDNDNVIDHYHDQLSSCDDESLIGSSSQDEYKDVKEWIGEPYRTSDGRLLRNCKTKEGSLMAYEWHSEPPK